MITLLLCIVGLPVWLVGAVVFYHVVRPQKSPADSSNRINKLRLVWFALTREDYLSKYLPWLTKDEMENIHGPR